MPAYQPTRPSSLSLLSPIEEASQFRIENEFWTTDSYQNEVPQAYWLFYARQIEYALQHGGRHISVRSHADLFDMMVAVASKSSRKEMNDKFRYQVVNTSSDKQDALLDASANLAATLLLMLDFGSFDFGFCGHKRAIWSEGSVRLAASELFNDQPKLLQTRVRLDKYFLARNLARMSGLRIVWTDNLADHLRLADEDTAVYIFHHATFLRVQEQGSTDLLPAGLARETVATLALLFPSSDRCTQKWFRRLPGFHDLDPAILRCGSLKTDDRQIEHFRFWHDRLVVLKQVFDEAEPRTLSQWWYDRRSPAVWFGFWNAIAILALTALTLLFGVVQCFEGGIQAWASMKALRQTPS